MKRKSYPPVGPFSPPTPSEAEQSENMPMAVARDMDKQGDDSFLSTSAPLDAGLPTPTPHGERAETRRDENRARESPEGYGPTDENGFRQLLDEE